jgi:hypothetical protein
LRLFLITVIIISYFRHCHFVLALALVLLIEKIN